MGGSGVPEEVLARLHPLEVAVLPHLKKAETLSGLAKKAKLSEVETMRALQWLENKGAVELEKKTIKDLVLGPNGKKALEEGLPEQRFLESLKKGFTSQKDIKKKAKLDNQEFGASVGILKKAGFIEIDGKKYELTSKGKKKQIGSDTIAILNKIKQGRLGTLSKDEQKLLLAVRKRKNYIESKEKKDRRITLTKLGKKLADVDVKKLDYAERLTKEDLETGKWKEKKYRAYDVTINVPRLPAGKIHFVQEATDYIRRIWVEMGFTEMTGSYVQNAFWDLDALFVPQDHPARELQDTFYLEHPDSRPVGEKHLFERVRDVHEHGGNTGSKGWRYRYSREEAERLMLRTHTTVLSAQTLRRLKQQGPPYEGKFFTVGKVFRNEKLDWKHLFEFTQVEGIVIGKDVNLAQHIGYLRTFFRKMGFPKIRCRPSHFPYTEPSVEVDVWHPEKEEWVELGGSGIFRPELTKALLGVEVPVLAWGLGLERIIVDFFGLDDLRDLYRNDIGQMQNMKRFIKLEDRHG